MVRLREKNVLGGDVDDAALRCRNIDEIHAVDAVLKPEIFAGALLMALFPRNRNVGVTDRAETHFDPRSAIGCSLHWKIIDADRAVVCSRSRLIICGRQIKRIARRTISAAEIVTGTVEQSSTHQRECSAADAWQIGSGQHGVVAQTSVSAHRKIEIPLRENVGVRLTCKKTNDDDNRDENTFVEVE